MSRSRPATDADLRAVRPTAGAAADVASTLEASTLEAGPHDRLAPAAIPPAAIPPAARPFDGAAFARGLGEAPGVYRMYAADDSLLYVGKASVLRNRVASYFNATAKSPRIQRMLVQVARMEVTVTRTEAEALLLENQLIKSLLPRYNVLLRDDKTYPHILITREAWPRISAQRGPRSALGRHFGPYPSAGAVRETLNLMQRLFRLRSCEDSVFRNRSRPCLQYQIGRCLAPCVGLVAADAYADAVRRAEWFLDGKSRELTDELTAAMETASAAQDYEQAARLRDLIAGIRQVQAVQFVDRDLADLDALAVALRDGVACVVLLAFRDGRNLGTRSWFPDANGTDDAAEVLAAFVGQHYASQRPPREIVLDRDIPERALLESALAEVAGQRVRLKPNVRGERAGLRDLVQRNAALALSQHLASRDNREARRADLARLLELEAPPARIECFDISHTQGEATVASCVVFDADGPASAHYRRFNITGITPGDDYAAMRQALERRFRRVASDDAAEREQAIATLPDLLLIDGGAGQLRAAREVLGTLGIGSVNPLGVAKGPARKPGEETLILADGRHLHPGAASPGLQLVQQVRDEAHRFAITGHRGRRQKARTHSRLEDIAGIGPRRRAALLRHFGGLAGLKAAGCEEIARVTGINAALAARIYATLHGIEAVADSPA